MRNDEHGSVKCHRDTMPPRRTHTTTLATVTRCRHVPITRRTHTTRHNDDEHNEHTRRDAHNTRRRARTRRRGSAEARGGIDTYRCVCGCVVLWLLKLFAKEKNSKKRGVSVSVLVVDVDKHTYVCASGQTYVRQVLPPTVYSFELVAVSHCFSRHHV